MASEIKFDLRMSVAQFNTAMKQAEANMRTFAVQANTQMTALNNRMKAVKTISTELTNSIEKIFGLLEIGFVGMGASFALLASHLATVQEKMAQISAVSSEAWKYEDMQMLYEVAVKTGASFEDVAKAAYEMNKAGIDVKNNQEMLFKTLQAGTIHLGEYESATRLAVFALNTFRDSTLTAAEKMDYLHYVAKNAVLDMENFEITFKMAAATAEGLGIKFEELVALQGAMSKAGLRAERGARGIATFITNLVKIADEVKRGTATEEQMKIWNRFFKGAITPEGYLNMKKLMEGLRQIGLAGESATSLLIKLGITLNGIKVASVSSLASVNEAYNEFISNVDKSRGALDRDITYITETVGKKIERLKNTFLYMFSDEEIMRKTEEAFDKLISLFATFDEEGNIILTDFSINLINAVKILSTTFGENIEVIKSALSAMLPLITNFAAITKNLSSVFGLANENFFKLLYAMLLLKRIMPETNLLTQQYMALKENSIYMESFANQIKQQEIMLNEIDNQISELNVKLTEAKTEAKRASIQNTINGLKVKRAELQAEKQDLLMKQSMVQMNYRLAQSVMLINLGTTTFISAIMLFNSNAPSTIKLIYMIAAAFGAVAIAVAYAKYQFAGALVAASMVASILGIVSMIGMMSDNSLKNIENTSVGSNYIGINSGSSGGTYINNQYNEIYTPNTVNGYGKVLINTG